jgi:hypothetical protein
MKDDMDIEKTLKQYRSEPSPGVKQSVMNRFGRTHRGTGSEVRNDRLWKRPVPLYLFATSILVAIGLAFFAGRMTTLSQSSSGSYPDTRPAAYEDGLQDIQWEIAPNDLL